eukprot:2229038-Pyramimonas_sp.AAC.1
MESGLRWLVIRWQVEDAVPRLPDFLQAAGNQTHGSHRVETKTQILLRCHAKMMQFFAARQDYNKEGVVKAIEGTTPAVKGHVMDMCNYIEKWGGGSNPIFLKELSDFSKTLSYRRDVSN